MTPKQKANELTHKFMKHSNIWDCYWDRLNEENNDILCAVICVDEIMSAIDWHKFEFPNEEVKYWYAVKDELEIIKSQR